MADGMIGDREGGAHRLPEPVVGFRSFTVKQNDDGGTFYLQSPYIRDVRWYAAEKKADCRIKSLSLFRRRRTIPEKLHLARHRSPGKKCYCGLYSYEKLKEGGTQPWSFEEIAAVVVSWGRVCIHRDGCRAEWMKILALSMPPEKVKMPARWMATAGIRAADPEGVKLIGAGLKVPVLALEELPSYAAEFGSWVPSHARPD